MDKNSQVATVVHPCRNSLPALDHTEALEVGAQQALVGGKEIWQYPTAL